MGVGWGWPCKLPSITAMRCHQTLPPGFPSYLTLQWRTEPGSLLLGGASQQSEMSSHLLRTHIFIPSLRPFLPSVLRLKPSGPSQDSCRKSGQLSSQREGHPQGAGTNTSITEQPRALLLPSTGKNIKKTSIPRRGRLGPSRWGQKSSGVTASRISNSTRVGTLSSSFPKTIDGATSAPSQPWLCLQPPPIIAAVSSSTSKSHLSLQNGQGQCRGHAKAVRAENPLSPQGQGPASAQPQNLTPGR